MLQSGLFRFVSALAVLMFPVFSPPAEAAHPNIVVLVADDVGFSDFGAYGSEISTSNIDALAGRGTLFTNFHASPACAPTRAMLMTGVGNHRAGVGNIPETLPASFQGHPSYLGRLRDDVVSIAELLSASGYRTYLAGKWHLGHEGGALPSARGFQRSFALDASGADNWEKQPYVPYYRDVPWFENGEPADLPEDFYSSEFFVDKTIDYIEEGRQSGQPFFAYIGFQAVHIPVQAPRAFTEKYEGVYQAGWQALRQARFDKLKAAGLIPQNAELGSMPEGLRDWDALPEEERRFLAKSMAVNAGMIEAMDHHIGRLIAYLKKTGEYENTLFVLLSDNGPESADPLAVTGMAEWLWLQGYRRDYETLGEKGSYVFIGPEFASAAAAPGAFFKMYAGEGGLRVPLIISGAGVKEGVSDAFAFVSDLVPTILGLADITPPENVNGVPVQAFTGASLVPVLHGRAASVRGAEDVTVVEVAGNAALFRGGLKLVRNMPPRGDGQWRLYDIEADPGETQDLSAANPLLFAELRALYDEYAEREGILDMPEGYMQLREMLKNTMRKQLPAHGAALLILLLAAGVIWWAIRRHG